MFSKALYAARQKQTVSPVFVYFSYVCLEIFVVTSPSWLLSVLCGWSQLILDFFTLCSLFPFGMLQELCTPSELSVDTTY